MASLGPHDIALLFLALAVMLGCARGLGELFRKFGQPAIVGEIIAGILLGPTVLGALAPGIAETLFPASSALTLAFDTIEVIAVVLLLLIAGLEVDLSVLWRQGKAALLVSILGVVIPFSIGFGLAYALPDFWGITGGTDRLTFALFFGTALSISALPVAARILMDLGMFKTDIGMLIMAAAMFNDLTGWIIFAIVLGMMNTVVPGGAETTIGHEGLSVIATIGLTLGFVVVLLTVFRWLVHRILPWIQANLSWPGGVLSFILVLAFAGAAVTEAIGIHAIFGAFLVGIAIGDSEHLREHTRSILNQFVTNIFAPIFFVSIGLQVNFLDGFNILLVLGVLVVSIAGKSLGSILGARWGGLAKKESYAVAAGMNAHGAMEVILGLLALEYGIIQEEMFIALVVLALVGATISGPAMSRFIVRPKRWMLADLLDSELYVAEMDARNREEAIQELSAVAAETVELDVEVIADTALERERLMGTGIGEEIAVPHARLEGLTTPVLVIGHSEDGLDFDSPDGKKARLVFLLLTPLNDHAAQVQIFGQIARCFNRPEARQMIYDNKPFDVLRAFIKIEPARHESSEHA